MVADGLEAVLVGDVLHPDQLAVGRRVRVLALGDLGMVKRGRIVSML